MKKEFIRVRSVKDIIIFVSLIVAGGILIALPTGAGLNITGFFLIFAGLILAMVLRTAYKDVDTGEIYSKNELYFQQAMHADILSAIQSGSASVDLTKEGMGNALKLDIYYSRSTGKAYLQMFEYVPYKYEPCSVIYEYETAKIADLIKQ